MHVIQIKIPIGVLRADANRSQSVTSSSLCIVLFSYKIICTLNAAHILLYIT